ncbi:hypothetical protein [Aquamicrobium soli]|uniref:Uncharacterized protein n=1 Tax=Aquamicrobium soli TaxID=1811518 RepID=A0ABV7KBA6_9HYPH
MDSADKDDIEIPSKENSAPLVELFDPWAKRLGFDKSDFLSDIPDLSEYFSSATK